MTARVRILAGACEKGASYFGLRGVFLLDLYSYNCHLQLSSHREIHPLDPQPHRYCMLASTASAPQVTRCSLGLYWSSDLCTAGCLGDVILSRSDSERQRNLMIHDQRPLPVYFSQVVRT